MPDRSEWDDDGRLAVLRTLIHNYTRGGGSFGVTVLTDGALVTGQAVDRSRWIRTITPPPPEAPETAAEHLSHALHQIAQQWSENDMAKDEHPSDMLKIRHLHLVDVQVIPVGTGFPSKFRTWQVPLARIAGWTLGEMNVQPSA